MALAKTTLRTITRTKGTTAEKECLGPVFRVALSGLRPEDGPQNKRSKESKPKKNMENKFNVYTAAALSAAAVKAANDILAEIHVPVDEAIAQLRAFILKTEYPANKAYVEEVLAAVLAGRKEQLQKKQEANDQIAMSMGYL